VAVGVGTVVLDDALGAEAHARDLVPRLARLLERAGVARTAGKLRVRAVFVGLGPGSYTGLRVGLASALALARAADAELYGLSSFEALAFAELAPREEGTVALDARAGRFYHARYRRSEHGLLVLDPPASLSAEELAERCRGTRIVFAHPDLDRAAGLVLDADTRIRTDAWPSARGLLALGRAREAAGELARESVLEPLYLAGFGRAGSTRADG
jgi:tRNA threonylcarbamoyladenosine biosynthesis protein TsaB